MFPGLTVEALAQPPVGAYPAGDHELIEAGLRKGVQRFRHQHVDDRFLERGRDIGLGCGGVFAHQQQHCGLKPAERKIQIARLVHLLEHGPR